eukprot:c13037_g1_i3.p1 GENE.c13037_g1_i3~~c13037_g1_i3.p1  ORF type:complete len:367 (-),score=83.95 c13037_g1_i3:80-1180(-)
MLRQRARRSRVVSDPPPPTTTNNTTNATTTNASPTPRHHRRHTYSFRSRKNTPTTTTQAQQQQPVFLVPGGFPHVLCLASDMPDVWTMVFSHLTLAEIVKMRLVCRAWREIGAQVIQRVDSVSCNNPDAMLDHTLFELTTHCPHIKSLDLSGSKSLQTIACLRSLTHLTNLNLHDCRQLLSIASLTHFTPQSLTHVTPPSLTHCTPPSLTHCTPPLLTHLTLSMCTVLVDVGPVGTLTKLTRLDLSHCRSLKGIAVISNLRDLKWLSLASCFELRDLSALTALTKLEYLCLSSCVRVDDFRPAFSLPLLSSLDMSGCQHVTSVSFITDAGMGLGGGDALVSLRHLSIAACRRLSDLSPLGHLSKVV